MNNRSFFFAGLLTALLVASCTSAESPNPIQTEAIPQPEVSVFEDSAEPEPQTPTEIEEVIQPTEASPTEASEADSQPEFVPRGPDLEATDPTTVSLATGDLQLIEFFRFT